MAWFAFLKTLGELLVLALTKWLETEREKKELKKKTLEEIDEAVKKRDWSKVTLILSDYRNRSK